MYIGMKVGTFCGDVYAEGFWALSREILVFCFCLNPRPVIVCQRKARRLVGWSGLVANIKVDCMWYNVVAVSDFKSRSPVPVASRLFFSGGYHYVEAGDDDGDYYDCVARLAGRDRALSAPISRPE